MKTQIQLCKNRDGIVERFPIDYNPDETLGAFIGRTLGKTEDYYGPGCYVPLGKSWPNLAGWLEIRACRNDLVDKQEGEPEQK